MLGFTPYNYETFRRNLLIKDMVVTKFLGAPKPGDKAPDFEGRTIEGDRIRLSDYQGERNVVLTIGSATCPFTAASIRGLNDLYEDFSDEVEFLFVYVREAHPGEEIGPHKSMADKVRAAELLRDEEDIQMPIIVDDLHGRIHRKYGKAPNPTYLIDRSGRIAFRMLNTNATVLGEAIEELLDRQEERGVEHVIVHGGEYHGIPKATALLHTHRALKRGGQKSIDDFKQEMGWPGRLAVTGSHVVEPIVEHPVMVLALAGAAAGVVALGIWGGLALRKRRLQTHRDPYNYGQFKPRRRDKTDRNDYEAVGI
jgi:alkyl hydroperoxide reductase subunit AhpC